MKYRVTAWYLRNDDFDCEEAGSPLATLEEAQVSAQSFYAKQYRRPYSMSISNGIDIWNWKKGKEWKKQN